MFLEKVKFARIMERAVLSVHSSELTVLLFMALLSILFLFGTILFLTTGDEQIFLHDMQFPFLSNTLP